nr:BREX-1 system adenine-specific DNA-methyltransferase PglX [Lysobacter sp. H21R4]
MKLFSRTSALDILKIPGAPIAYWVSTAFIKLFSEGEKITSFVNSRDGLTTGDNEKFIRYHWEISRSSINFTASNPREFWDSKRRFAPLIKGGGYRKWYGNLTNVITYDESAYRMLSESGNKLPSRDYYFRECLNWTRISSPAGSFRYTPHGCIFESASLCAYSSGRANLNFALAAANSCIAIPQLNFINPTTNLLSGYFDRLRVPSNSLENKALVSDNADTLIRYSTSDWNESELSWHFEEMPLLKTEHCGEAAKASYNHLLEYWREIIVETQRLEEENNRVFIDAYGLQDELTPDVPLKEITLTCNPHYRYGGDKTDEELEALLLADTMREFLSYAVGCMFGRYSLDRPGLVLANQGETLADYLRKVPEPRFMPDEDNVIPLLDGEWFHDDVTERFRQFLRVTFGDDHYTENLAFIQDALGKDVRKYFLKDFYTDHLKRYKKRPIYWLFTSPKSTFSALIYLHRYRPDTVSVVLQYLRDFRKKLAARLEHLQQVQVSASASQGEKTKAVREADTIRRQQLELDDYERDTLYPLATEQVELDLDDGVKVNYLKLGDALKKIPGLAPKGDD